MMRFKAAKRSQVIILYVMYVELVWLIKHNFNISAVSFGNSPTADDEVEGKENPGQVHSLDTQIKRHVSIDIQITFQNAHEYWRLNHN